MSPDIAERDALIVQSTPPTRGATPEVGGIDPTARAAQKLRDEHPEVIGDVQGFLDGLKKTGDNGYSIRLRDLGGNQRAGVRLDFDGIAKRCLMTAFDADARTPSGRTTDVPGTGGKAQAETIASAGAGPHIQCTRHR